MSLSTAITRKLLTVSVWFVFAFFFAYSLALVFLQSPNIAGVENNTVYFIQQLLDGNRLYTDPALPPYSIAQYGPLYYQLVAGIARIGGVNADDIMSVFILSRAVSLTLLLLTAFAAWLIGKNIFHLSKQKCWLLFAVVFIFFEISSFSRADSLANTFYFYSAYLFMLGLTKRNGKGTGKLFVFAAAVSSLAIFSKQSSLTLPMICGLYLLLEKKFKNFLFYSISFVLTMLIGFVLIQLNGGLELFYKNVVKGVDNGFDISTYLGYILRDFLGNTGLLCLVLMVATTVMMRMKKNPLSRYLTILVLLQFVLSVILALKKGSSSNYFTEWWVLVLIVTAYCWEDISAMLSAIDSKLAYLLIMIVLFFRASTIAFPFYEKISPGYRVTALQKYEEEKVVSLFLKENMRGSKQLVYNNIFSPDTYLNSFLFREAIMPQHDVVVFGTYYRDVYDYSLFRKQVQNGEIGYIIDRPGEQDAVKLKIDMSRYKEIKVIGNYHIYKSELLAK